MKRENIQKVADAIIQYLDCFEQCDSISREEILRRAFASDGKGRCECTQHPCIHEKAVIDAGLNLRDRRSPGLARFRTNISQDQGFSHLRVRID